MATRQTPKSDTWIPLLLLAPPLAGWHRRQQRRSRPIHASWRPHTFRLCPTQAFRRTRLSHNNHRQQQQRRQRHHTDQQTSSTRCSSISRRTSRQATSQPTRIRRPPIRRILINFITFKTTNTNSSSSRQCRSTRRPLRCRTKSKLTSHPFAAAQIVKPATTTTTPAASSISSKQTACPRLFLSIRCTITQLQQQQQQMFRLWLLPLHRLLKSPYTLICHSSSSSSSSTRLSCRSCLRTHRPIHLILILIRTRKLTHRTIRILSTILLNNISNNNNNNNNTAACLCTTRAPRRPSATSRIITTTCHRNHSTSAPPPPPRRTGEHRLLRRRPLQSQQIIINCIRIICRLDHPMPISMRQCEPRVLIRLQRPRPQRLLQLRRPPTRTDIICQCRCRSLCNNISSISSKHNNNNNNNNINILKCRRLTCRVWLLLLLRWPPLQYTTASTATIITKSTTTSNTAIIHNNTNNNNNSNTKHSRSISITYNNSSNNNSNIINSKTCSSWPILASTR